MRWLAAGADTIQAATQGSVFTNTIRRVVTLAMGPVRKSAGCWLHTFTGWVLMHRHSLLRHRLMPNDILWLSAAEANKLHFSNNGIEPTTAEPKQVNGLTYLRIEQKYTSYSARFIFNCARRDRILLMGGIVTNLQDAKQVYDLATQSFFTLDQQTIQTKRKGSADDGLMPNDSTIWVTRVLTPAEVQKLLASTTITAWVAADGAVGHTGPADISGVRDKVRDFVSNCSFHPQGDQ
ncbi:hypothetical protein [Paraburkholderia phytofirmans]|uniref:hypothetical protein n=1 Tax=Paraburkholderia phytofirmans TaxID=261302 RepID=UPI0038B9A16B